jgi:NADH-quinone oxidoreductase subunit M
MPARWIFTLAPIVAMVPALIPVFQSHLLSLILLTPVAGAAVLLTIKRSREDAIRWVGTGFAGLGFLVSLPLWFRYDPQGSPWQFTERATWIPSIGASYFLGVDGFSALLVLMTTLLGFIAVLSSWLAVTERVKEYYIALLVLQAGMVGAFVALDALLFFVFWEVMLVPMYLLIGVWGGGRRLYSASKFFLYWGSWASISTRTKPPGSTASTSPASTS